MSGSNVQAAVCEWLLFLHSNQYIKVLNAIHRQTLQETVVVAGIKICVNLLLKTEKRNTIYLHNYFNL